MIRHWFGEVMPICLITCHLCHDIELRGISPGLNEDAAIISRYYHRTFEIVPACLAEDPKPIFSIPQTTFYSFQWRLFVLSYEIQTAQTEFFWFLSVFLSVFPLFPTFPSSLVISNAYYMRKMHRNLAFHRNYFVICRLASSYNLKGEKDTKKTFNKTLALMLFHTWD